MLTAWLGLLAGRAQGSVSRPECYHSARGPAVCYLLPVLRGTLLLHAHLLLACCADVVVAASQYCKLALAQPGQSVADLPAVSGSTFARTSLRRLLTHGSLCAAQADACGRYCRCQPVDPHLLDGRRQVARAGRSSRYHQRNWFRSPVLL